MSMNNIIMAGVFVAAFSFLLGAGVQAVLVHDKYRTEAIERGFAQHNQETGVWEWKKEK